MLYLSWQKELALVDMIILMATNTRYLTFVDSMKNMNSVHPHMMIETFHKALAKIIVNFIS